MRPNINGSIASSGAVVSRASTWMYVGGEWGFMLGMEAPLSTVEVARINCEYRYRKSMPWSNCVYRDRTLELRFGNNWNQSIPHLDPKYCFQSIIPNQSGASSRSKLESNGTGQRLGGNQDRRYGSRTLVGSTSEEESSEANQSDQD